MTFTIRAFNESAPQRALELLQACCGSARWTSAMLGRRPFISVDAVLTQADDIWQSLDPNDWYEAFAHHPRIGERESDAQRSERASAWSAGEQAAVATAPEAVHEQLAKMNREYEARFGFIYIVCATGKSTDELLALARQRMNNAPMVELGVAAEEQRKITRLRLVKLFAAPT
ncbi:MAG: 2-oxo-4-hydroxy-4-carboxy-5-ureidoimidazoline decarboxylase [bacterium]